MSSTSKQAQETESQNEQYFRVTGKCIRVKNGQMQCDLQPVDPEPMADKDCEEEVLEISSELIEGAGATSSIAGNPDTETSEV